MSENTKAHLLPILADHVCQSLRSRVDGYCVFSTLDGMSRLPTSCRYSISVSLAFMDMVGAEAETIFKYLPKDMLQAIQEKLQAWHQQFIKDVAARLNGDPDLPPGDDPFKRISVIAREEPELARSCFRTANDIRFNADTPENRVNFFVDASLDTMSVSLSVSLFGEKSRAILSMSFTNLNSRYDVSRITDDFLAKLTEMGLPDRALGEDYSETWRQRQEIEIARFTGVIPEKLQRES